MGQVFGFLRQKSRGQRPRLVANRLIQLSICSVLTQRDTMALDAVHAGRTSPGAKWQLEHV